MTVGLVHAEVAGAAHPTWTAVCAYGELVRERGVAALVDGVQVALFRGFDDALYAVGNRDPFSGAYVLARGLVGTRGDAPFVTSPLYKQAFDLRNGRCMDDDTVTIPVFAVRTRSGVVEVSLDPVAV